MEGSRNRDAVVLAEHIERRILLVRGRKVMLDRDLAALYGVSTGHLKRAVKRNSDRFPDDFMFVLSRQELANWRCQNGISSADRIGLRHPPMAFTEQGVAMLSGVLSSPRAIRVNIAIMRTFARLRQILASHEDLVRKLDDMERKYDEQFRVVFDALRELMNPPEPARRQIGFSVRERRAAYRVRVPGKGSP